MTDTVQDTSQPLIIFLPGFGGTSLKDKNGRVLWGDNVLSRVANSLKFFRNFKDLAKEAIPGAPLQTFDMQIKNLSVYGNLLEFLKNTSGIGPENSVGLGLDKNQLLEYGYDWRQDIQQTANLLANKVVDCIQGKPRPLGIIAHSQGGLLARVFIHTFCENEKLNLQENLKLLVQIGSPVQGTLLAYRFLMDEISDIPLAKALLRGLLKTSNLNIENIREVTQKMPALYQLLPPESKRPLRILENDGKTAKELSCFDILPKYVSDEVAPSNLNIHRLMEKPLTEFKNLTLRCMISEEHQTDYILNVKVDGTVAGRPITTAGDGSVTNESAKFQSREADCVRFRGQNSDHLGLCNNETVMQEIQKAYCKAFDIKV